MIHRELSHMYHKNAKQGNVFNNDWYNYLVSSKILNYKTSEILAKTTHVKIRGAHKLRKPAPLPGKVIAAQTFGFWIKVIETTQKSIDWKTIFFKGFKGHFAINDTYWDSKAISDLLVRLEQINELRNRIAHHEPLWKFTKITHWKTKEIIYESAFTPSESIQRMKTLNHRICIVLGWLSKDRRQDYENSYYKRHFDWFCREQTIEIFKNNGFYNSVSISKGKRELGKFMRNSCLLEITHKNGAMLITRDF
ncbi:CAAX protease [Acinetobacter colistiniresistens]|uniref:CAAX protease n=1 Tax=Acinetobacter colistiniresistens TaxID=280145 RepID=UPI00211CB93F|nr:CAAX protease [Acinetobacter colistiniresistens]UUM26350.1 CAAX protease [Acinetobacter colistiniresistens]